MSLYDAFGRTSLWAACTEEFIPLIRSLFSLSSQCLKMPVVLRTGVRIPFAWAVRTVCGVAGELALWELDFDSECRGRHRNFVA